VSFGPLCYHAQQAAEKAVKAVLIARSTPFPYIHDVGRLLDLARASGVVVPESLADADLLTDYASMVRYPGKVEIELSDYNYATATAAAVADHPMA
jgi:HEPN domain-containing protein